MSAPGLPFLPLLLLLASQLRPALPCYACFAKSAEKFCTTYMRVKPPEIWASSCWIPIRKLLADRPIYWVKVAETEYKELKSIYSKALTYIKRRRQDKPTETYKSLLDSVEQAVLYKIYSLKEATPCNHTCGINKAASYYSCLQCRELDCEGIPFVCPIEDVKIKETGQVSMKCQSTFTIPRIDSVNWWFVRSVRSDIIQQFKILHVGLDDTLTINNVKLTNAGTYACDVLTDKIIVLRRFFHLIVVRSTLQSSLDIQAMFQNVLVEKMSTLRAPVAKPLASPDQRVQRRTEAQLMAAVSLATIFVILTVVCLYRWAT